MMHVTSMPGNEWANHAGSMHVMFLGQRSRSDDSVVIISHQEFSPMPQPVTKPLLRY